MTHAGGIDGIVSFHAFVAPLAVHDESEQGSGYTLCDQCWCVALGCARVAGSCAMGAVGFDPLGGLAGDGQEVIRVAGDDRAMRRWGLRDLS